MKKVLLFSLLFLGCMNFCFGQVNAVSNKISVKSYDNTGLVNHLQLEGNEAVSFDIPAFIMENNHMRRIIINGSISSDYSITTIKFDSKNVNLQDGDYICKDVQTTLKPFLGVKVTGRDDLHGVDIDRVVDETSADNAGMTMSESITEFDGAVINSHCDLIGAVRESEIGDRVEVKIMKGSSEYSKYVVVGYREINTVTYNYCREQSVEENFSVNTEEVTLTSFPNPTNSTSYVNFKSISDEDITFSVVDIKGNLVHREIFSDVNSNLRLEYDHRNESDGTYIFVIQQGKEVYKHLVHLLR